MTQTQSMNKAIQLLTAATLTNAMAGQYAGLTQAQAEPLIVTQFERWYNLLNIAMMPNGGTMPDGSVAHPPGVFDDPPMTEGAPDLPGGPAGLKALADQLMPFLRLIPGAGPILSAATGPIAVAPLAPKN